MTEQQIREIAEAAFKCKFPHVKLHRVNVWPGFGFEDDSPVVDVSIPAAAGFTFNVPPMQRSAAWLEGTPYRGRP